MKKFMIYAACATMLASCSNDEDFAPQDGFKDTPITVSVGVNESSSRAGYEGISELPKEFYLTITQDAVNTASQYNYTNVLMTKGANNDYNSATKMLWKDNTRNVTVNAYTTEAETFSVQTDQSTADGVINSDLLGAVSTTDGDVAIDNSQITINFRHLLCKLDVTFKWGKELAIVADKAIAGVEYQDFGTNVALNREACTIDKGETTGNIKGYVTTADEGVTYLSEAIFAPQMGETPKIVITTEIATEGSDAVERRIFSINVKAPEGGFIAGRRYTMNVSIGGTPVGNESVTATISDGWGEIIPGDDMSTN